MKRIPVVFIVLVLALSVAFAGGSSENKTESAHRSGRIGVSLVFDENQKGKQEHIKALLEDEGYRVDLQYCNGDPDTQNAQIIKMIGKGCKAVIVMPCDGGDLSKAMESAMKENVPVISYREVISGSDYISYHVDYDYYTAGKLTAQYIVKTLNPDLKNKINVEFFLGDSDNPDNRLFYEGAYSALEKYYNSKTIVSKTRQTNFVDLAIPESSTDEAVGKLRAMVASFYSEGDTLDVVVSSDDSMIPALRDAAEQICSNNVLFMGAGCLLDNVKDILAGKQVASVFYNPKALNIKTVEVVNAIVDGETVQTNKNIYYNNGVKDIPACLCEAVFVDYSNIKDTLVDSGYYKSSQLD